MKSFYLALGLGLAAAAPVLAQDSAGYQIALNLEHTTNDQVKVVIKTPPVTEAQATYVMPSVVPGSYSKKDYGRFVQGFTALDRKGQKLKVKQQGANVFIIDKGPSLARIEYLVNDTWDVKQDDGFIFQPGGTNFEAGKNFVLNHYGLYGYLEGYKMQPYQVTVAKPADLYGATSLSARRATPTQDVFTAASYVELSDSPILYSRPDTASFSTGGARIAVSVVSETGAVKAVQVREIMRPMAEALTKYFGQMPVPAYHFLMYFPSFNSPLASKNGGYGAMEHSYSSVYFLPEVPQEDRLRSMVQEVASHEFLHMLAPLNIHSREIGEFDFRNPKMSQHLWLYEGVTEYIAQLVQVRGGLSTPVEFRERMKGKIDKAAKHPSVSFTEMSRKILEAPYKDMYDNVYDKGALIGFLLDIRIQELSQGKQTLRDVLLALRAKYGPTRSFEDAALIPEVVALTNPAIQQFFDQYVIGSQPLPYAEYFDKIGWRYQATGRGTVKSFGRVGFRYDTGKNQFLVANAKPDQNAFGVQDGDVVVAVNGTPVTMVNAEQLLRPIVEPSTAEAVRLQLQSGTAAAQERQAAPREFEVEVKNAVEEVAAPTPAQLQLRNQVLKPLG